MADLNKVMLIGRVGRDPEIRYTQSGNPIAGFSLATSERWKSKDGEKQESTQWHKVSVFGKMAEVVRDYVSKGKQIYIEGQVTYEEWNDKDGNKRNTTKIKVDGFNGKLILLGSKGDSNGGGGRGRPPAQEDEGFQAKDEDVPF